MAGPSHLRAVEPAIILTAAAPWFLNGLHSTPDDGPSSRELMVAIFPHVLTANATPEITAFSMSLAEDEFEDEEDITPSDDEGEIPSRHRTQKSRTVPVIKYGCYFLATIRCGPSVPVPRQEYNQHSLSERTIKFIFGVSRERLFAEFCRTGAVLPPNHMRTTNKKRITTTYIPPPDQPTQNLFALEEAGVELNQVARDGGSDFEDNALSDDEDAAVPFLFSPEINSAITLLYRQWLVDMATLCSNRKNAALGSYCILTPIQRLEVTEFTYENPNLAKFFDDCSYKVAENQKEWRRVFNNMFPPKGTMKAGAVQNYPNAQYYTQWVALWKNNDAHVIEAIRHALRKRYNKLYWVPHAETQRIWTTSRKTGFTKMPGLDTSKPAPRILLNPRKTTGPFWNPVSLLLLMLTHLLTPCYDSGPRLVLLPCKTFSSRKDLEYMF